MIYFSGSSVLFCFYVCRCPSFCCMRRQSVLTYASTLAGNLFIFHEIFLHLNFLSLKLENCVTFFVTREWEIIVGHVSSNCPVSVDIHLAGEGANYRIFLGSNSSIFKCTKLKSHNYNSDMWIYNLISLQVNSICPWVLFCVE